MNLRRASAVPADALQGGGEHRARQARPLRPHVREETRRALLRHQGDGRAVSHAGRARDRHAHARAAAERAGRSPTCSRPAARRWACRASQASGYLSGNGLLTATVFGRIAGRPRRRSCADLRKSVPVSGSCAISGGLERVAISGADWRMSMTRSAAVRKAASSDDIADRVAALDWTQCRHAARFVRLRHDRSVADAGRMRRDFVALRRGRHLPLARDHGAARLRPRRVQVLRLSAARHDRGAARVALSAARRCRQPLERADGARAALSRRARRLSQALPRGRARRSRRRCCCNTARATTIACIRTSMATSCFRCRSRSCCRGRARISPAASSCSPSSARACSRAPKSCRCAQGEGVIFPVHHRPVQGTRGVYRVNMRHGVSRLRGGKRHTLGIIFHDGK